MPDLPTNSQFIGGSSATPRVLLPATADSNAIHKIHHDVKKTLGGNFTVTSEQATGTARWYYNPSKQIGDVDQDLIATGESFTDGAATVAGLDIIMAFYIKHLGVDNAGNDVTEKLYISLEGNPISGEGIVLDPFESCVLKVEGVVPQNFEAETSGTSTHCMVEILAYIDDIA